MNLRHDYWCVALLCLRGLSRHVSKTLSADNYKLNLAQETGLHTSEEMILLYVSPKFTTLAPCPLHHANSSDYRSLG